MNTVTLIALCIHVSSCRWLHVASTYTTVCDVGRLHSVFLSWLHVVLVLLADYIVRS